MAPVSIRSNNPGAINDASWVREFPGYAGSQETTPGNRTVFFETPEDGVAAWYELLRRYRTRGIRTLRGIIYEYCGKGREKEAASYTAFVMQNTDLPGSTEISLDNDRQLLSVAKAFFRYEAGQPSPLTDAQILDGFNRGRAMAKPAAEAPAKPSPAPSRFGWLLSQVGALFTGGAVAVFQDWRVVGVLMLALAVFMAIYVDRHEFRKMLRRLMRQEGS